MLVKAGTFSKDKSAWGLDLFLKQANGAKVLCNDDVWRTDWTSSLGQNLLGQGEEFGEYLARQVQAGVCGTLPFWLEYEVAAKLSTLLMANVPGWGEETKGVRFGKTGTDATNAAVRLARAVTGRDIIVTFKSHYHGWGEWSIARTPPALGIGGNATGGAALCQRVVEVEWENELQLNHKCGYGVAAVIFEHPPYEPKTGWPEFLRSWCDRNGALLIADEVVTGLRYGMGGACGLYGYEPDLICMGKALGNGMPISALIGQLDYMQWFAKKEPVFWSSTANGNPVDLAAANFVLEVWDQRKADILWSKGRLLIEKLREAGVTVNYHQPRSVIEFETPAQRGYFIKAMAKRYHLVNRPNLPNLAICDSDIADLGRAAGEVMQEMAALDPAELSRLAQPLPVVLFEKR